MKVALIFTGLLRCFEQAYPAFKQYFLDRYDVDVYFDIWTEVGFYSGKNYLQGPTDVFVKLAEGDRGFHDSGELVNVNRIIELYNPVSIRIEDFNRFEPQADKIAATTPNGFTRSKNTISQAYKVFQGMQTVLAKSQSENYQMIVRARPDLVLEADPGIFQYPTSDSPRDVFYTLPSRNKYNKGTGDSLQIGSLYQMYKFSEMYHDIRNLYQTIGYSCPHEYVERYIRKLGFMWQEIRVGSHIAHSPNGLYKEPV